MQVEQANPMTLSEDQLRDVDRDLLDYLHEGRVTPVYARDRMDEEGIREVTSAYLQQRLKRLVEHNHARNLFDTGLYELTDDPREDATGPTQRFGALLDALKEIDAAFERGDPDAARAALERAQEAIPERDSNA
ncbi:hypothetical protein [Haloterrigena salifodinae]|uniref:hypothetical protein n=1 Tax=Haloterrigena salifodinae TaxID=2675099 RepID=UPI002D2194B4|nr:hypothetical protein [Haloterrigena salifodinae]